MSRSWPGPWAALIFCGGLLPLGQAQQLILTDGTVTSFREIKRVDNNLVLTVEVGGGRGEFPMPLSRVARLEMPQNPAGPEMERRLQEGLASSVVTDVTPLLNQYAPFKDIPGNPWPAMALIKIKALLALHRSAEAEELIVQINRAATDEVTKQFLRVYEGSLLIHHKKFAEAAAAADEILRSKPASPVAAAAFLMKGDALLGLGKFEPALLTYLRIVVYHSSEHALLPAALWGSAQAYEGLGDQTHSLASWKELVSDYPTSWQAAQAKALIAKADLSAPPNETASSPETKTPQNKAPAQPPSSP